MIFKGFRTRIRDWWRERRCLKVVKDEAFVKDFCLYTIGSSRLVKQYSNTIQEPFNEILDLASNLSGTYFDVVNIHRNDSLFSSSIERQLEAGYKDMKVVIRNFDYMVSKMLQQKVEQESKTFFHKPVAKMVRECFDDLSFQDQPYREWAIDSFERVTRLYTILKIVSHHNYEAFPVIDQMLYFALVGYRMERAHEKSPAGAI